MKVVNEFMLWQKNVLPQLIIVQLYDFLKSVSEYHLYLERKAYVVISMANNSTDSKQFIFCI